MGITLKLQHHSPTLQANMRSLLVVSVLFGALASVQAIKVGSESKVDSKSKWPYGSGYGMMGHGMIEDCMMCDSYHGCPSWCYGWNYPYQANVVISEKSDNKVTAQPAAEAKATGKWMYPYGYGYQRQCWMCDRYYGCPSWCYGGWNYPYQALPSVNDKSDSEGKWWYGNGYGMMGHDMMDDCMMCDMYHGCPSWCYNNWDYPYQALPAVNEKSVTKTDSKGKWWYGNGYYGYQRECMMCSMYGCPSWCYNGGWNYPYQALAAVGEKSATKTESKGKWWYGNGYYGNQRECMMCSMYGCPSWCYNGGWNYPYQTLPAVGEKSETKTESKGKWWYGNGYGMMGHDMMDDCMMCDMYHGCPSWCYNKWNYPYQALATVDDKTKTDSKGKWWYGNGYGYQRECMMCGMYGCPSWCYRWNPW